MIADAGIGFLPESTAPEGITQQITMILSYNALEKVAMLKTLLDKNSRELLTQNEMTRCLEFFWIAATYRLALKTG